jgi:hypothetical protein
MVSAEFLIKCTHEIGIRYDAVDLENVGMRESLKTLSDDEEFGI